jgi:hypothetical protein
MRQVGADPDAVLLRQPLALRTPTAAACAAGPGPACWPSAARCWAPTGWTGRRPLALLARPGGWALAASAATGPQRGSSCAALPAPGAPMLIDPLCVAALNTPMAQASAAVFLRVLRDALFGGPGAPTCCCRGARSASCCRAGRCAGWPIAGRRHCASGHADAAAARAGPGRSTASPSTPWCWPAAPPRRHGWRPDWRRPGSAPRAALRYEPIVTVYVRCPARGWCADDGAGRRPRCARAVRVRPRRAGGQPGRLRLRRQRRGALGQRGLDATAAGRAGPGARCLGRHTGRPAPSGATAHRGRETRHLPLCARPGPARRQVAPGLVAAGDYVATVPTRPRWKGGPCRRGGIGLSRRNTRCGRA